MFERDLYININSRRLWSLCLINRDHFFPLLLGLYKIRDNVVTCGAQGSVQSSFIKWQDRCSLLLPFEWLQPTLFTRRRWDLGRLGWWEVEGCRYPILRFCLSSIRSPWLLPIFLCIAPVPFSVCVVQVWYPSSLLSSHPCPGPPGWTRPILDIHSDGLMT